MAGIAGHGQRVRAVCAGVGENFHLVGGHRAIVFDAGFHPNAHRVTRAAGNELFFAAGFVHHGATGGDRQVTADVFDLDFLFAAKTAANAGFHDADALDRQSQHGGEHSARVEGHLRAGADYQTVIFVPVGDANMRLNMRLLHLRHVVNALENAVGFGKTFFYITDIDADFGCQVFGCVRVGEIDIFRFIMQDGSAGFHRFFDIQ